MSVELFCLVACAILSVVMPLIYAPGSVLTVGLGALMGNREEPGPTAGWGARGARAHLNLTENLVPFAIAIVVAHILNKNNGMTTLGAEIFLAARLIHAITYIIGIPVIRTLAYFAGFIGTVLVLLQLFR